MVTGRFTETLRTMKEDTDYVAIQKESKERCPVEVFAVCVLRKIGTDTTRQHNADFDLERNERKR